MTTDADLAPRLTDDQIVEVMGLLKGSDSAELKVSIPGDAQRATIAGLPLDPIEAEPRQVFFFDTPDLDLNRAGMVVRARRIAGGRGDTVIKLRPVVPSELPEDLRSSGSLSVEVDMLPGGFVCSASLKGRSTADEVREAVTGETPLRKLYSKEQREFFGAHAPDGITFDGLVTLGPTFVLKAAFTPEELARRIVAELWFSPDGSRILELSTKCQPSEAFQVAAEARAYLAGLGISAGGAQQTKTRTALDYFVAEHRASAATAASPGS